MGLDCLNVPGDVKGGIRALFPAAGTELWSRDLRDRHTGRSSKETI